MAKTTATIDRKTKFRAGATKVAATLSTVALVLATCEIATRCFANLGPDLMERDPQVGWRYYPNYDKNIYSPESEMAVRFRTNDQGFRGEPVSEKKPANVVRIAVVGDSFTAAHALPESETFCGQLETFLNSQSDGKDYEVLNFGITGSSTGQELELYRGLIRKLNVDCVIVAFGNSTDLRDNSPEVGTKPVFHFTVSDSGELTLVPPNAARESLTNSLNAYSRFYAWQKLKSVRLKQHFQGRGPVTSRRPEIYCTSEPPVFQRAWRLTAAILKQFRIECAEDGVALMVVSIPAPSQVYGDLFAECQVAAGDEQLDPLHPDIRMAKICQALKIPHLSLTAKFRRETPANDHLLESEQYFFKGVGHFNEAGSRLAAAEIDAWIRSDQVALSADESTVR